MRKVGAALIMALLITATAGGQLVNFGKANPTIYTMAELPIISVHLPANNTYVNVNEILLNFTITRPRGWEMTMSAPGWKISQELQSVSIQIDSKLYRSITVNSNLSSAPFRYFVYLTNLTGGEHNITVNAFSSAFEYAQWYSYPHSFTITSNSTVNFTLDTISPAIQISSIENETYYKPDLQLNFTVNEPVSKFSYVLDAQENVTISANSTLSGLPVGLHNVTVYAWDAAGNVGSSETVSFTVAEPESFPTVPVAAVSAVVIAAVIAAGLLLYNRRRRKEAQQK